MNGTKNILGREGEDRAVEFLKQQGYRILERNYRSSSGEIDVIAEDKRTICFVEVRTRTSDWHGHPFESVSRTKRMRLSRVALSFLQDRDLPEVEARFDVVAVIPQGGGRYHLDIIKNAFEVGE